MCFEILILLNYFCFFLTFCAIFKAIWRPLVAGTERGVNVYNIHPELQCDTK